MQRRPPQPELYSRLHTSSIQRVSSPTPYICACSAASFPQPLDQVQWAMRRRALTLPLTGWENQLVYAGALKIATANATGRATTAMNAKSFAGPSPERSISYTPLSKVCGDGKERCRRIVKMLQAFLAGSAPLQGYTSRSGAQLLLTLEPPAMGLRAKPFFDCESS